MSTVQTLIDNARTDMKIDPGKVIWTDAQMTRWVNEAVQFIYGQSDFKFEMQSAEITPLVAAQANYAFASDYRKLLWAKLVDLGASSTGADEEELTIITDTLVDFEKTHDMDYSDDKPGYFYEKDEQFYVYPIPNATSVTSYKIKYGYSEYPDTLTATDSPGFPAEWHFIIENYIRYKAWASVPGNKNRAAAQDALSEWDLWSKKAIADMLDREQEGYEYRMTVLPFKPKK